jgi:hypothetical protein
MATLYVSVFHEAGNTALGDPLQEFSVTIASTSNQSTAITATEGSPKRIVRTFADADCFVTWGSDPTASASDGRAMGQENPEYWHISAGDIIAVISRT